MLKHEKLLDTPRVGEKQPRLRSKGVQQLRPEGGQDRQAWASPVPSLSRKPVGTLRARLRLCAHRLSSSR